MHKLKSGPCVDCGKHFPPVAMDFDHVRGEKQFGITMTKVRGSAEADILQEVAKCELRCACCHRIRHGEEHETED